ncbi:PAS domain-containing protein [Sulfitobacter albidus]|uniref:PAS domain-containing protein n=1 Tax=Sulfitobacter albidus TaxID=2829501 RepID=A0A975PNP3_9RHOB|nr:PAS domain-containing protein [Sulfitobacter albidus]QUJ77676.1 PAS domain-containing protein [Sulfitobacter albidus]
MDKRIRTEQNVITMPDFRAQNPYGILSQVEAYWDALREGDVLPKRSQVDPRGIERALEYAFILERVTSGVARMRLAGSHLHDLMGMEVRGMTLTSLFEDGAQSRIAGLLEEVFQTPATAEIWMRRPQGAEGRMLLLPLRSDLGDVSRILGCMICPDAGDSAGQRFDLGSVTLRAVGSCPAPAPQPAPQGFAEPSAPFEAAPADPKRPPYLRLVKNDNG